MLGSIAGPDAEMGHLHDHFGSSGQVDQTGN
jgi:hypothetical protein